MYFLCQLFLLLLCLLIPAGRSAIAEVVDPFDRTDPGPGPAAVEFDPTAPAPKPSELRVSNATEVTQVQYVPGKEVTLDSANTVTIAGEKFKVEAELGSGGSKRTYLISHLPKQGQPFKGVLAMGVYINPTLFKPEDARLTDQLMRDDSPHLRREVPGVEAIVNSRPDDKILVSLMEYSPNNTLRELVIDNFSPTAVRYMVEDMLRANAAQERMRLLNPDIKPSNVILMGPPPCTEEKILKRICYLAVSDFDVVIKSGFRVPRRAASEELYLAGLKGYTPSFAPLEFYSVSALVDAPPITRAAQDMQLAFSLYEQLFQSKDKRLFQNPEFFSKENLLLIYDDDPIKQAQGRENYEKMLEKVKENLKVKLEWAQRTYPDNPAEIKNMEVLRDVILNFLNLDPAQRVLPEGFEFISPEVDRAQVNASRKIFETFDLSKARHPVLQSCGVQIGFSLRNAEHSLQGLK